jgi:hypothetical protein
MLKPVYFPFTHLGDRAAAALQAQFDSILLLRPYAEELPPGMRELEGRGFLEVLTPALGDEAGGAAAVGEFLEWARRHAGGVGPTGAFWQAHLAGDPVGGDRSAFQLASQIRRRSLPDERLAAADPLPAAQLFLRLAQELDEQDEEVLRDLARCQTHQAELMEALAGRPRVSSPGRVGADGLPPTGHEEHRIAERLSAWARLFPACFRPSPVLVTTSAAVLELLVEASEAVRRLPTGALRRRRPAPTEVPGAPAAPLMEALAAWAAAPAALIDSLPRAGLGELAVPGRGDPLGCLFPNTPTHRLLRRFAASDSRAETTAANSQFWKHTIVVLVPLDRGPLCGSGG